MEGVNGKRGDEAAGSSSSSSSSSAYVIAERNEMPQPQLFNEAFHDGSREHKQRQQEDNDDDSDDDKHGSVAADFVPGPLVSLKEQIEKDKEDESLRKWKEKLLGCLESDIDGQMDPEVKFHSIGIISDDFGEIVTPLPVDENQHGRVLFALSEGSRYRLKFKFSVLHNIVSGLAYSNTVWKGGLQVDENKGMLGTFAPKKEPYVHVLKEETTPSGALARRIYSAKLKFEDDDRRCHLELKYLFHINKSS